MKIATILNAHGNTNLVSDTVDAIRTYSTKDILMVVDGAAWESWGKNVQLPIHKLEGFYHNYPKAPYRNLTYGLNVASQKWPDHDWYCYCEYDVLFTSSAFQADLEKAAEDNVWCIGNDLRIANFKFPYLEMILDTEIKDSAYLLGCCVFYSGKFIRHLKTIGFFDKFLQMTNDFEKGYFPDYEQQGGYDFGEHLYPTLAKHYGGQVRQFACYHQVFNEWIGNFKKFPMRWKPEITLEDNFCEASIIHPVKDTSDLRWFHHANRTRRKKLGNIHA